MTNLTLLKKKLKSKRDKDYAKTLARFFKTGPGDYGEGDIFWGIKVPVLRRMAKNFLDLNLTYIADLLQDKVHELRMLGVIILTEQFKQADEKEKKKIYNFYLSHLTGINNWDLVDVSAPLIVGEYLLKKPKNILQTLALSKILWERRIAIVATFTFIRNHHYDSTLLLAKKLLDDEHDLIHKAVGWMLREIGKRNEKILINFLDKNSFRMPRTMLRYAIERLPERKRQHYLKIKSYKT